MTLFPVPENMTLVTDLLPVASGATSGALGVVIYIVILFAMLMITASFNSKQSFLASSFVLFAVSFFLKYLGLLGDFFLWLSGLFLAIAMLMALFDKSQPGA